MKKRTDIKKLSVLAMFAALAFVSMSVLRIPVVSFLKYEPKDCIIAIAGFIYGPLSSVLISVVVSLIEFITVSDTGIIGCFMNVVSTLLFVLPAALMYKKNRTIKSAVIGLIIGTLCMTAGMILWNYIVTPWYMHVPRADIVNMLLPVFLPFNLLKAGLNTAVTLLLYKRVVLILRKTKLLPVSDAPSSTVKTGHNVTVFVASGALLVTLIFVLLAWKGII